MNRIKQIKSHFWLLNIQALAMSIIVLSVFLPIDTVLYVARYRYPFIIKLSQWLKLVLVSA